MKQIVFPVAVGFLYNFLFNFLGSCLNEAFLTVDWFVKLFVQSKHLKKCVANMSQAEIEGLRHICKKKYYLQVIFLFLLRMFH